MTGRTLTVYGYGDRFERRFGTALAAAGLEVALPGSGAAAQGPFVVSCLDGDPAELPASDGDLHDRGGVVICDRPDAVALGWCPEITLPEDTSAESLLFFVAAALDEGANRRRERRHLAPVAVLYRRTPSPKEPLPTVRQGELMNVSLGGAFVRSLDPPEVRVRVEVEVADGGGPPALILAGRVVRSVTINFERGVVEASERPGEPVPTHPGFGVAFDPVDQLERARLEELIERLGDRPQK